MTGEGHIIALNTPQTPTPKTHPSAPKHPLNAQKKCHGWTFCSPTNPVQ